MEPTRRGFTGTLQARCPEYALDATEDVGRQAAYLPAWGQCLTSCHVLLSEERGVSSYGPSCRGAPAEQSRETSTPQGGNVLTCWSRRPSSRGARQDELGGVQTGREADRLYSAQ